MCTKQEIIVLISLLSQFLSSIIEDWKEQKLGKPCQLLKSIRKEQKIVHES